MKRILAFVLVLVMILSFAACNDENVDGKETGETDNKETDNKEDDLHVKSEGVMTYAEYAAAALEAEVTVECFVQAHQAWWDNKITVYAQDKDGAYFLYEMPCSEEDSKKLTEGTKIRVKGRKAEWSGEVEIIEATFEILEGKWVAEPMAANELLGKEELINHQNKLVSFTGLTVEKIEYKNGEPGDDIYVTLGLNGASYSFCVEYYLTGSDTEVYKTVGTLKEGDKVDVEAFLYWYNGANPHITSIVKK